MKPQRNGDLSLKEVAAICGCHVNTIRRAILPSDGKPAKLAAYQIGGHWRVTRRELDRFRGLAA